VAGVGEASILTEPAVELERKIRAGEARVGVLGLGYVGLPLCVEFATAGLRVVGYDLARDRVANVNAGRSHIGDVPAERVAALVRSGRLSASFDLGTVGECDALIICVPDAAEQDQGSGPVDGRRCLASDSRPSAGGAACRPREHDLSWHDRRADPANPRGAQSRGRALLFSGILARAGRSREPQL